ncbi:MAG: hypothetical protein AAB686_00350 [Patescibacteria group bacterium]
MPEQKPLFVEKSLELMRELIRLVPALNSRVEQARRKRIPLEPGVEECLVTASLLKEMIREMEEEVGRIVVIDNHNNQLA